jgi:hypothetical protein
LRDINVGIFKQEGSDNVAVLQASVSTLIGRAIPANTWVRVCRSKRKYKRKTIREEDCREKIEKAKQKEK